MTDNQAATQISVRYVFTLEHETGMEDMYIDTDNWSVDTPEKLKLASAIKFLRKHRPFHTYRIVNIAKEIR